MLQFKNIEISFLSKYLLNKFLNLKNSLIIQNFLHLPHLKLPTPQYLFVCFLGGGVIALYKSVGDLLECLFSWIVPFLLLELQWVPGHNRFLFNPCQSFTGFKTTVLSIAGFESTGFGAGYLGLNPRPTM